MPFLEKIFPFLKRANKRPFIGQGKKRQEDLSFVLDARKEERFRAIYEYAPILICGLTEEGRCFLWNKEAEKQLGFRRKEMEGKKDPLLLIAGQNPKEKKEIQSWLRKKNGRFKEITVETKEGEKRHQMWASIALPNKTIINIGYDVTEKKKTEERLKALNQSFLLFSANSVANINKLTELTGSIFEADMAFYYRLEGDQLISLGRWHAPPSLPTKDKAEGHVGYEVIKSQKKEAYIIPDLSITPYAYQDLLIRKHKLKTYLGYPVQFGGETIGVLCVLYKRKRMFSLEEREFIGLIAHAVGIEEQRREGQRAITKRFEFEQLLASVASKMAKLPSDQIDVGIEDVLKNLCLFSGCDRSYIFLVSEKEERAKEVYEWCVPGIAPQKKRLQNLSAVQFSWWAQKLRQKEPIILPDTGILPPEAVNEKIVFKKASVKSALAVPLILGMDIIGFIGLDAVKKKKEWPQEIINLLEIMGATITHTIYRKQYEENLRERRIHFERQKAALLELTSGPLPEEEDLNVVLRTITEIATKTLDIERASIWKYDSDTENLLCKDLYERSSHTHSCGDILQKEDYPTYFQIMQQSRLLVANEVLNGKHTQELLATYYIPFKISSCIDAPIRLHGETIGVVCLDHIGPPREWTMEEQSFAGSLADAVAMAVEQRRRKKAEDALEKSEATLKEVLNLDPNLIFAKDIHGHFILVNEAVANIYGTTVEDLLGKTDADFAKSEEEVRNFRKDDLEVIQTGKRKFIPEETITDAAGQTRYLQTTKIPFVLLGSNEPALLGVSVDITLRRKAEEALKQSEQKYRDLVETSRDLIWAMDDSLKWTFVNKAAENIYGYSPAQIVGRHYRDFLFDKAKAKDEDFFMELKKGKKYISFETSHRKKNGKEIVLRVNAIAMRNAKGKFIGITGTAADITKQKKTQRELEQYRRHLESLVEARTRELRRSERLAATGRLAASMAHEINNPLQGIITHLEIIQDGLPEGFPYRQNYNFIKANIEKIGNIVGKLLNVHRLASQEKTTVDVHEILQKIYSLVEPQLKRRNISLRFRFADDLPFIQGWPQQLHQVFLNLILNAQDSIKDKKGEIIVTTMHDEENVFVSVEDTGEGIKEDILDRIFEPFFTTKEESGTGLGLFVSQGIIRDHGGEIRVKSQFGKGSSFTIRIPFVI